MDKWMSRYNHKFSSAFLTWTIFLQHCFFPRYSHHHQVDQYRLWDLLVFSLTHFKTIHTSRKWKKSFSLSSQESSKLQSYLPNEKKRRFKMRSRMTEICVMMKKWFKRTIIFNFLHLIDLNIYKDIIKIYRHF